MITAMFRAEISNLFRPRGTEIEYSGGQGRIISINSSWGGVGTAL